MAGVVSEGHYINLGAVPDLWTAVDPGVAIVVDTTRKSLLDLTKIRAGHPCYFVQEIRHGAPILEVCDGVRTELTEYVLVFDRPRGGYGVVTKTWFDQTDPPAEPNTASGTIESGTVVNKPDQLSEPSVALSPSLEAQLGKKGTFSNE